MGPSNLGDNRSEVFVPVAEESALRQTRWQKVIYPNKITRKLSIGFKPYTLVATLGPSSMRNAQWARTWECNRWMPFNWANTSQYDLNPDGTTASLYMYGPYLVPNSRLDQTLASTARSTDPDRLPPIPRPEISKLHRGADLGSISPDPLGIKRALAASVRPRYEAQAATERTRG